MFDALLAEQHAIEAAFGAPLHWEPLDDRRACRISYGGDGGYRDSERWPAVHDAMIDAMVRLERALAPHLPRL